MRMDGVRIKEEERNKKKEIVCLEINWTLIKINLKKFVIMYLHPNHTIL